MDTPHELEFKAILEQYAKQHEDAFPSELTIKMRILEEHHLLAVRPLNFDEDIKNIGLWMSVDECAKVLFKDKYTLNTAEKRFLQILTTLLRNQIVVLDGTPLPENDPPSNRYSMLAVISQLEQGRKTIVTSQNPQWLMGFAASITPLGSADRFLVVAVCNMLRDTHILNNLTRHDFQQYLKEDCDPTTALSLRSFDYPFKIQTTMIHAILQAAGLIPTKNPILCTLRKEPHFKVIGILLDIPPADRSYAQHEALDELLEVAWSQILVSANSIICHAAIRPQVCHVLGDSSKKVVDLVGDANFVDKMAIPEFNDLVRSRQYLTYYDFRPSQCTADYMYFGEAPSRLVEKCSSCGAVCKRCDARLSIADRFSHYPTPARVAEFQLQEVDDNLVEAKYWH